MLYSREQYCNILNKCFETNSNAYVSHLSLERLIAKGWVGKYVGCVHIEDKNNEELCVCINNSAKNALIFYPDSSRFETIGKINNLHFSYTSGVFHEKSGSVFGFPRNSSKLLRLSIADRKLDELVLPGYWEETKGVLGHHYSGAVIGDFLYCVPRLSNYILAVNLIDLNYQKLVFPELTCNAYNGAVLHPNGKIYFTPMRGAQFCEFSPATNEISLFGPTMNSSIFGGAIYSDGNIYSYGANQGLWRCNIIENSVDLIADTTVDKKRIYGSYGTIVHYNGCIYNIPGNTPFFYEYNPYTGVCKTVITFDDGRFNKAKWAGGALLKNGHIFLTPAFGRFAAVLKFKGITNISEDMSKMIYTDYFRPL